MSSDPGSVPGAAPGDMPPEEFRLWAGEVVGWISRYLREVEDYPVFPTVRPGEVAGGLDERAPEKGEPFAEILRDFEKVVVPGITHWNHPSFHGYFAVTGSAPGILGEMLTAALNVNAMVWRSSPAATEVEERVLDWLRELVGLPEGFRGAIQDTASVGSLTALSAARHRAYPEARKQGLFGLQRGRIYASEEAHSSIDKAGILLGFGVDGVRRVAADEAFRMKPPALRAAIEEDLVRGVRPVAVVATVGTTSTASPDPVADLADLAEEFGLWLHVDAAYAGASAMVPEMRHHFRGWERAASVVFNPHKWLFTPVDCSVLLTRHPEELRGSLALTPEYLRSSEGAFTSNLMDYGVALGRRFRSLKLWFILRYFGAEGVRERIRHHVRLARTFGGWVEAEPGWELTAPVSFSTVSFRYGLSGMAGPERDALNLAIMERVNTSGKAFLSHTSLRGRIALRLSIGNLRTEVRHLESTWEALRDAALQVEGPDVVTGIAGNFPGAIRPPSPRD